MLHVGPCPQYTRNISDSTKTPWGDTPRDILKIAQGTHRAEMTWQHESAFTYDVEGTSTTLTATITRNGPATLIDVPKNREALQARSDGYYLCEAALHIPVHVKVETQDGAIAAEGNSTLTVKSRRYMGLSLGQQFGDHRGTLQIRELKEKGMTVPGFGINLGLTRKRVLVGEIRGSYEVVNVGARYVEYACFPNHPPSELLNTTESPSGCR